MMAVGISSIMIIVRDTADVWALTVTGGTSSLDQPR
jgi:hypothetical protein